MKDWIIVLMVQAVLDTSNFASLESQIVFVMTLLLILPEIVKSIFLASSFVQILELEGYQLNVVSKIIAKIFLTLSGPLLPRWGIFEKLVKWYFFSLFGDLFWILQTSFIGCLRWEAAHQKPPINIQKSWPKRQNYDLTSFFLKIPHFLAFFCSRKAEKN